MDRTYSLLKKGIFRAVMVEFEDGSITRINPRNQTQQESLLKRLLTPDDGGDGYKGVKMVVFP